MEPEFTWDVGAELQERRRAGFGLMYSSSCGSRNMVIERFPARGLEPYARNTGKYRSGAGERGVITTLYGVAA